MLSFGAGTLPALSAVVVGSRLLPARLRAQGTRLVAVLLVVTGLFMLGRSLAVLPGHGMP